MRGVQEVSDGFSVLQVSPPNFPLRHSSRIAATNITSKSSSHFFANHFMFPQQLFSYTCNRHCELRDSRNGDFINSTK